MQLPKLSAHYGQFVRFGRYVAKRLRREKREALAKDISIITQKVRDHGRAYEDCDDEIQDAFADRDAADDDLDDIAKEFRVALAGRSADAVKQAPYTLIFPDGLGYYTAAPIGEEVQRYELFAKRIQEHLPASDAERRKVPGAVSTGLKVWVTANKAVEQSDNNETLAQSRLNAAVKAWVRQVERVYGSLIAEFGKSKAERFFPRISSRTPKPASPAAKAESSTEIAEKA